DYQKLIRNLKKEEYDVIGYAKKFYGNEDHGTRISLLKSICQQLRECSLVGHVFVSFNFQT
ncbi:hypothetical protein BCV72DRAFT_203720, partial [Rhizopus microsporus var. microsporus]